MLFLYVPDEAVYWVHDNAESRYHKTGEIPTINPELSFPFPEPLHPLNSALSDFFGAQYGFFHYSASVIYTIDPLHIISQDRYPALHNLVLRVEVFKRLHDLSIVSTSEESDSEGSEDSENEKMPLVRRRLSFEHNLR